MIKAIKLSRNCNMERASERERERERERLCFRRDSFGFRGVFDLVFLASIGLSSLIPSMEISPWNLELPRISISTEPLSSDLEAEAESE